MERKNLIHFSLSSFNKMHMLFGRTPESAQIAPIAKISRKSNSCPLYMILYLCIQFLQALN